jgi:hypothetical protein
MELFLLDFVPTLSNPGQYIHRKLEKGTISSFEKLLTTKLDRSRLDKETRVNRDNDAANLLFNDVAHMYDRIDITKSKEKEVVNTTSIPNNIANVLDEVMDFNSNDDAVNMDDHGFDEDYEDNADENDDNEFGKDAQLCLSNIFNLR